MVKMHPLGHSFMPAGSHACRLRFHGKAPLERLRKDQGVMEATAVGQRAAFESAVGFALTGRILAAPEPSQATKATVDGAHSVKVAGDGRTMRST